MSASQTSAQNTNSTSLPQNHSGIVSHVRDVPQQSSLETRPLPEPGDFKEQLPVAITSRDPKVPVSPTTPTNIPSTSNSSNAVDDVPRSPPTQQIPNPSVPTPAPVQVDARSALHAPPASPKTNSDAARIDPGALSLSASNETVPKVDVNPPPNPSTAVSCPASVIPSLPSIQPTMPEQKAPVHDTQQFGSESLLKDEALSVPAVVTKQNANIAHDQPTPSKIEASVPSPLSPHTPDESTTSPMNFKAEQTAYSPQHPLAQSTPDNSTQKMQNDTQGMADSQKTVDSEAGERGKGQPLSAAPDTSEMQFAAPTQSDSEAPVPQPAQKPHIGTSTPEENSHLPSTSRPLPRNLPKFAKNRPKNARVFIGNLASEYTSSKEIVEIFHKYGTLIEEPVLRRSFGFVQYSTAEAASLAVMHEQNRIIGGIALDLSIADNREVKKGTHIQNNTPFQHPKPPHAVGQFSQPRGRIRERDHPGPQQQGVRKRRRSVSPNSALRKGGVHPPQYRRQRPEPKNGIYLRILCMSPTAKGYARHCENTFRNMTRLNADILHIVATNLGEALGKAMRDAIPYVMVVASRDVEAGTCTIRTLEKTGYEKSGRGNGVIPLKEAVEVCLIERGVIMPNSVANQYTGTGAGQVQGNMGVSIGNTMHRNMGVNSAMGNNRSPWNIQTGIGPQDGKTGWVNGSRVPRVARNVQTGASNMGNLPMQPPPPQSNMANTGSGGYGYDMHMSNAGYGQAGMSGGRGGSYGNQDYMGTQGFGADYSRNPSQAFNANGVGAYPEEPFNQSNNRGTYGSRADNEYDPAAVTPTQRPNVTMGDGYAWNRRPNARHSGYGAVTGATNVPNTQRMGAPYSAGRQYEFSENQYDGQGRMPYGNSYDSTNPYGNVGTSNTQGYGAYGNVSGSYGPGNETREQYNPQSINPRYSQQSGAQSGTQYRNPGWSENGAQRPMNNHMGGNFYNSHASNNSGRSGGMRGQAEVGQDNRYIEGEYGRSNINGEYGGPQVYGNRQSAGVPGVSSSGANAPALNTGVDIGRLNHLISAFQQKQAAQGIVPDASSRVVLSRMGARRDGVPPPPPSIPSASGAAVPPVPPQGVSHVLSVAGAQQALHHIGGGQLGSYPIAPKGSGGFSGGGSYHPNPQHGLPPQGGRRGPGYYQRG
ncbi:unnamed protein product [Agarophyton chilense]|eukprot:gb/GEZJ01003747.1/.p1 GENE.gb/GEZJ01003747.1/~~gb/GEZJ01003747.1/.p1  ORF type:complete len:1155 (-),score=132.13 gb/GEZJ01003747.1/:1777-5241(-)